MIVVLLIFDVFAVVSIGLWFVLVAVCVGVLMLFGCYFKV